MNTTSNKDNNKQNQKPRRQWNNNNNNNNNNRLSTDTRKCYNCGKTGHLAKDCRSQSNRRQPRSLSQSRHPKRNKIVSILTVSEEKSNICVLDSSSTVYILNTLEHFDQKSLKPCKVQMRRFNGKGTNCKLMGRAHIKLQSGLQLELKDAYYMPTCRQNLISTLELMRDNRQELLNFIQ